MYWGTGIAVDKESAPNFVGRSFTISADIAFPDGRTTGVLVARGRWFGGWSFYLKDGVPVAASAFSETAADQSRVTGDRRVSAAKATLRFQFQSDGGALAGGELCIFVNDAPSGCGRIAKTVRKDAGQGETFDISMDTSAPVPRITSSASISPGEIAKVTMDVFPPK